MQEKLLRKNNSPVAAITLSADILSLPSVRLLSNHASTKLVYNCSDLVSHQADDVFALWTEWEEECGHQCNVPYWAVVWPGASVLANYVLRNPSIVQGKSVLDLGCGGAVAGIGAALAGASSVIANDIDPVALYIAEKNSAANGVSLFVSSDDLMHCKPSPYYDVILVADMFYQREQSIAMLEYLQDARLRGTTVLIADGHRPFAPKDDIDLLSQEWIPVNLELEGVSEREVRLLSLRCPQ